MHYHDQAFSSVALTLILTIPQLYSFEPLPTNFKLLENSIRLNPFKDRMTLIRSAAAAKVGQSTIMAGVPPPGLYACTPPSLSVMCSLQREQIRGWCLDGLPSLPSRNSCA